MTTATGANAVQERRGGLIVPVPEAEATLLPAPGAFVPIWSGGMPAHVTLLFPFPRLEHLDAAGLADLTALFAGARPIRATFAAVGHFQEVVYLAPEPRDWFISMTQALSARFGLLPYGGLYPAIVPHLTVARYTDPASLAQMTPAIERQLPIQTEIRTVWLVEEAVDGHWDCAATFPVGP